MGLKDILRQLIGPGQAPADAGVSHIENTLDETAIDVVQVKIGYEFRDKMLLAKALLHRSHVHLSGDDRVESNERLEFLGDAILGLVVNEYLYRNFPNRAEGDLTKMKSLLVCGARLSEVAGEMNLGEQIRMSRSEAATGGRKRSSILADTMEAIFGAVYLDGGLKHTEDVIRKCLLETSEELLKRRAFGNYKSRLQEIIQAEFKSPPRYKVISADGPDHARIFEITVSFGGVALGTGSGKSKKAAEQKAAMCALDRLEKEPDMLTGLKH